MFVWATLTFSFVWWKSRTFNNTQNYVVPVTNAPCEIYDVKQKRSSICKNNIQNWRMCVFHKTKQKDTFQNHCGCAITKIGGISVSRSKSLEYLARKQYLQKNHTGIKKANCSNVYLCIRTNITIILARHYVLYALFKASFIGFIIIFV